MNKIVIVIGFVLAAMLASGQDRPAASSDDVKSLQREMWRLKRSIDEAEKAAHLRTLVEREAMKAEYDRLLAQTIEAERKAAVEAERQRKEADVQHKHVIYVSLSIIVGILAVCAGGYYFLMRRVRANPVNVVVGSHIPRTAIPQHSLLIDPDIPTLEAYAESNNGITSIPFILTLTDGSKFDCTAKMRTEEKLPPLVYVGGDTTPVAWDKRRQRAAKTRTTVI